VTAVAGPYATGVSPDELKPADRPAWFTDELAQAIREIRDAKVMRALAHPTRLALLEALTVYGPLTATQASEYVGESPSSCSFHLRTLARHGFVEETGEGTGRQRPWRMRQLGTTIHGTDQTKAAADLLVEMYMDRQLQRMRRARASSSALPKAWRDASTYNETVAWLTAAEAKAVHNEVMGILVRYRDRLADPTRRPSGSRPVESLFFSYPTDFGAPAD
jgi:DNA-binding transcriptional ArsR family regulator